MLKAVSTPAVKETGRENRGREKTGCERAQIAWQVGRTGVDKRQQWQHVECRRDDKAQEDCRKGDFLGTGTGWTLQLPQRKQRGE